MKTPLRIAVGGTLALVLGTVPVQAKDPSNPTWWDKYQYLAKGRIHRDRDHHRLHHRGQDQCERLERMRAAERDLHHPRSQPTQHARRGLERDLPAAHARLLLE